MKESNGQPGASETIGQTNDRKEATRIAVLPEPRGCALTWLLEKTLIVTFPRQQWLGERA